MPSGSRRFDRVDERFDLSKHPNEVNRFGWVVEIDPFDPDSTPVKHTALGRFKHEGATTTLARDGRVVAYMGDDERFEYLYKFVSQGPARAAGDDRAQQDAAGRGHPVRGEVHRRSPRREIDGPAGCPGTAPSTAAASGSRWSAATGRSCPG